MRLKIYRNDTASASYQIQSPFRSFVKKICPAQRHPCKDRIVLGVSKCGSRHALCGGVGVCGF